VGDMREDFAANGDALLNDPGARRRGESTPDGGVPGGFVGLPAQGDAGASIFIAGLEHKVLALAADEREEVDRIAIVSRLHVRDHARPWDVCADDFTLIVREQSAIAFVGEHGEEGFYVRNLATKVVGHADGVGCVSFYERRAFGGLGDNVVDEHTAV